MSVTLNKDELKLVNKFRNRVAYVLPGEKLQDDLFLVRWLRARDLDMEKAERMLRNSIEWFNKNEMSTILDSPPKIHNFRFAILGHDLDGCPVVVVPIGFWYLHEIKESEINSVFRFFLCMLAQMEEEIENSSKQFGKPVTQVVVVVDYQQLAYFRCMNNRPLVKMILDVAAIFEANFPERLKSCIIVNTARLFPLLLKLVKPFLSSKTFNKMEIYGPQRKKWGAVIEQKAPREIIPPYYGGIRPGIDEYCSNDSEMWNYNEPLPANYYGVNNDIYRKTSAVDLSVQMEEYFNTDDSSWTCKEIEAGSQLDLKIVVSRDMCVSPTQNILWWVESEGYDIGMKVIFNKPEGQNVTKEIVNHGRIDVHLKPYTGSLVCEVPGVYILVLDNSYSKRRNKTVSYKAYVTRT